MKTLLVACAAAAVTLIACGSDDTTEPPTSLVISDLDLSAVDLSRAKLGDGRRGAKLIGRGRVMDLSQLAIEIDFSPGMVNLDASARLRLEPDEARDRRHGEHADEDAPVPVDEAAHGDRYTADAAAEKWRSARSRVTRSAWRARRRRRTRRQRSRRPPRAPRREEARPC